MKFLIGCVAAAIVLFVWGFLVWGMMALGDATMRSLDPLEEAAVLGALDITGADDGMYFLPAPPEDVSDTAKVDEWTKKHEAGPLVMMSIKKDGVPPMVPMTFVGGFAVNLVMAFLSGGLLLLLRPGLPYPMRVFAVVLVGLIAAAASHGMMWNWFYVATDHTVIRVIDTVVGFGLAGLVLAAVIGGTPKAAPAAA